MWKKTLKLTGVMLLAAGLAFSLTGCGKEKIGVVDVDKVVAESTMAKNLQSELKQKGEAMTKKLQESTKTGEEKEKEQQQAYQEFMQEKQGLEAKLDEAMKKAVEKAAVEKKIDTVLFKKDVHYGGIDITADVIKNLAAAK
ncbi:MAG: OmpH family outer membrane protein [bacterium]